MLQPTTGPGGVRAQGIAEPEVEGALGRLVQHLHRDLEALLEALAQLHHGGLGPRARMLFRTLVSEIAFEAFFDLSARRGPCPTRPLGGFFDGFVVERSLGSVDEIQLREGLLAPYPILLSAHDGRLLRNGLRRLFRFRSDDRRTIPSRLGRQRTSFGHRSNGRARRGLGILGFHRSASLEGGLVVQDLQLDRRRRREPPRSARDCRSDVPRRRASGVEWIHLFSNCRV